jgi:polyhydroxyalkanoate synthesis regulator phasin
MSNIIKDFAVLLFSAGDEIEKKADEFKKERQERYGKFEEEMKKKKEEFKSKFDEEYGKAKENITEFVDKYGLVTKKEIEELKKKIDELSSKLDSQNK